MKQPKIILASSSQTRKDLMNRLRLEYTCISPDMMKALVVRLMPTI